MLRAEGGLAGYKSVYTESKSSDGGAYERS